MCVTLLRTFVLCYASSVVAIEGVLFGFYARLAVVSFVVVVCLILTFVVYHVSTVVKSSFSSTVQPPKMMLILKQSCHRRAM